jgi:hypothetical protein
MSDRNMSEYVVFLPFQYPHELGHKCLKVEYGFLEESEKSRPVDEGYFLRCPF